MAINNATDHGYNADWSIHVQPGLIVRRTLWGEVCELKVVKRYPGQTSRGPLWTCQWIDGPNRATYWTRPERDILQDAYAP